MMRTRSLGPDPTLPVALGGRVLRLGGRDVYWHDAQDVLRFSDCVAIDPSHGRAVAVLGNTSRPVDAIAGALLLDRVPTASSTRSAQPRHLLRRPGRR